MTILVTGGAGFIGSNFVIGQDSIYLVNHMIVMLVMDTDIRKEELVNFVEVLERYFLVYVINVEGLRSS